jgi:hypothetical protein
MKRFIAIAILSLSLASCALPEVEVGSLTTPPDTQIPTQAIINSDNEAATISTIISTQELTQDGEQMDKEEMVLQHTVEFICPSSDEPMVSQSFSMGVVYSVFCAPSPGHATVVRMERFRTQDEAMADFNNVRGGHPVQDFHGYPLSVWYEDHPSLPDRNDEYFIWLWQPDQWLIKVSAFNDTDYLVAPDPSIVSEAIYRFATELNLFP